MTLLCGSPWSPGGATLHLSRPAATLGVAILAEGFSCPQHGYAHENNRCNGLLHLSWLLIQRCWRRSNQGPTAEVSQAEARNCCTGLRRGLAPFFPVRLGFLGAASPRKPPLNHENARDNCQSCRSGRKSTSQRCAWSPCNLRAARRRGRPGEGTLAVAAISPVVVRVCLAADDGRVADLGTLTERQSASCVAFVSR